MNKVFLSGYVGSTPEVTNFEDGGRSISFRLCTREVWRDASGTKRTDEIWHNIVASNNLADLIAKTLQKSYHVSFMGKIRNRSYEGNNGATVHYSEVVVLEIDFDSIKKPKDRTDEQSSSPSQQPPQRPQKAQNSAPQAPSQSSPSNAAPVQTGAGSNQPAQSSQKSAVPDLQPLPPGFAYKCLGNGEWVVIQIG